MGHPEDHVYSSDAESARNDSEQQLVQPQKSWKGYVWDTFDLPTDERWLMFKLDAFVLTFASVSA
jgi:ACS family pantothenate transporter-like MFS transporter